MDTNSLPVVEDIDVLMHLLEMAEEDGQSSVIAISKELYELVTNLIPEYILVPGCLVDRGTRGNFTIMLVPELAEAVEKELVKLLGKDLPSLPLPQPVDSGEDDLSLN